MREGSKKNIDNRFWAFNYSHVLSERQKNQDTEAEDKIKGEDGGQEVEDEFEKAEAGGPEETDQRDEGESEEDDLAGNKSSHTKKISLLRFVLMALIPLIL